MLMKIEELYNEWKSLFPLSEKQAELLRRKFTTEYNYNSNHIEGNTLTYGQTELLLLFGKVSGEGDLKDFVDMKASQVGVEMVKEAVQDRNMPLSQNFIRQLHKVLLREDYTVYRELPGGGTTSYTVHAGQYKTRPNSVITRYGDRFEYASPEETASLMSDLVDWYNAAEQEGKLSPVELAALFHYRYIRIHPFEDGNGRIARLMVNYIMARHGWPMIVIRNRKKAEYIEALHRADQKIGKVPSDGAHAAIGKITSFLAFFRQTVCEEMQCEIDIVRNAEKDTWWYDGQRICFRSENGSRLLALLCDKPFVTFSEMAEVLSINRSAVQKHIEGFRKKGYLDRHDDGSWHVLAMNSRIEL
ncbi:MAG: Fic family protein [Bacteroidaceae bacterium]|nr:Fic family protein [Bacteroidaceae bacterium]